MSENSLVGDIFNKEMKKALLTTENHIFVFIFMMISLNISAQEEKRFTVSPGKSITEVLSAGEIFLYPEFVKGKAVLNSGSVHEEKLNYNIILGEIQFIGSGKDTLTVSDPGSISYFVLAADTFYFNNGYYKLIKNDRNIKLLSKHYTKLVDVRKQSGYGTTSSTSSITGYSSIYSVNDQELYKLKASDEMLYSIRTEYYFRNLNDEIVPATRKSVLKMFPDQADKIKLFIKDQAIRFTNKEDLIRLADFIRIQ